MARLPENETPVVDRSNPTSFSAPVNEVRDNLRSAPSYSDRVRANKARTDSLKGKGRPLGGAEPLPPGKVSELTMPRPDFGSDEPFEVSEPPKAPSQRKPAGGVGAAYEVNQQMAAGELDGPVSMAEAKKLKKPVSAQTMEALKKMDENVKAATEGPAPKFEEEPKPAPRLDDDREKLDKADEDLMRNPLFGMDDLVRVRNSLLSEERRKKIEARLDALDIADMVTQREIQQKIPVVPGRLSFTVRTLNQSENLFCLQYTYEFPGSEAYLHELLNTAKMVCSLVAVNDAMLPRHLNDKHDVEREAFQKKWDQIVRFPVQLIGDLSVQLIWFQNRVNDLFNIDNLKNG